ncbi:MAG: acyl carrier protein [Bacteroidia bacterium]|nr:acyl carrier protein [Bacteroidia bacterium]
MTSATHDNFLALIRNQFRPEDREAITLDTDLKTLNEWSSLQTMIIVNEIDKAYNVILGFEDLKNANTVAQLFNIVQSRGR